VTVNQTDAPTLTEADISLFLLELEDPHEIKCESPHNYVPHCDHEVSYIVSYCQGTYRVCASTVDDPSNGTRVCLSSRHGILIYCEGCNQPASLCWKIRPI
jgi:hypothetical protein